MKALLDLAEKENIPLWPSQIALWIEQQGRFESFSMAIAVRIGDAPSRNMALVCWTHLRHTNGIVPGSSTGKRSLYRLGKVIYSSQIII